MFRLTTRHTTARARTKHVSAHRGKQTRAARSKRANMSVLLAPTSTARVRVTQIRKHVKKQERRRSAAAAARRPPDTFINSTSLVIDSPRHQVPTARPPLRTRPKRCELIIEYLSEIVLHTINSITSHNTENECLVIYLQPNSIMI